MKKILSILIIILIFSACSDKFLDTENKNTLDVGSFWKTENDLQLAVNSAYTPLAHYGMFGLDYFLKLNTLDPYIWFENPNGGLDQMIINTSDFQSTWDALYRGLAMTSDILANIGKVKDVVKPADFLQYKAQVTALRGIYYFYLVTWFNQPIYYDETNMPTNPLVGLKNGTPEEFWNKLEADLTFAADNLPDSWSSAETGRITRGAANAQLGKALLYKHYHYYLRNGNGSSAEAKENLRKAKEALQRVISSNVYHLIEPNYKTKANYQAALLSNFSYLDIPVGNKSYKSENNAESIWEIQYNDDNRNAGGWLPGWQWGGNLLYMYFSPLGYRNHEIDPTLWYEYESVSDHPGGYERDPRAYATCYLDGDTLDWRPESGQNIPFQSAQHSKMIVSKNNLYQGPVPSKALGLKKYNYPQFTIKSSPNCAPFNVRVIRYADVLLMYAEASYQYNGDDGTGLAALNQVRARVDMPPIGILTPNAIVHERTVELATEGHFYNDLVRWTFDPAFAQDMAKLFHNNFNKPKNLYFPIPQPEIDANKGSLLQNPGW
jgi:starch-binding outer membrane protein, SusD/RagB family